MPMQDENRSIVKAGILNWNHKNLNKLSEVSYCGKTVTCSDIAMKIVPKINAAGKSGFFLKLHWSFCLEEIMST